MIPCVIISVSFFFYLQSSNTGSHWTISAMATEVSSFCHYVHKS